MDASARPRRTRPAPAAGDVLQFAESDYCYGTGPLVLRVTRVGADLGRYPQLEWLSLRGVELRGDGSAGPERQVLVRTSALSHAAESRFRLPVVQRRPMGNAAVPSGSGMPGTA